MSRVFKLEVSESTEKLEFLLKQERNTRKRERLQFLYWYKTGQVATRKELGKLLNRSQIAISHWIKRYRDQGLQGLLHLNYRGGNLAPSISLDIQRQLKEKLAQPEGMSSYKEIQTWLQKTHGLEVPYSTVFGTVKYRLKATLKVPRPYAIEHDPQAVEDFKKKVPEYLNKIATHCLKKYSSIRYWAQDESRFGLKTIIPYATKIIIYAIGIISIFCSALKIKFLNVKEAKNDFGFDLNSSITVVLRSSRLLNILFAISPLDHCHSRSEELTCGL